MLIRTRFSPSPTGSLHIGSVRTALYSWLFAKRYGGSFILRIEDTDRKRCNSSSIKSILNGLSWLGLTWDEGPYYQSKRLSFYKKIIKKMLKDKTAYKCYCSEERLDRIRKKQVLLKKKAKYDRKCRKIKLTDFKSLSYVVRFRNPKRGKIVFKDEVRGFVSFKNKELDDLIIQRKDGTPTYNFCVVVDDWEMRISHVIRGEDHLNNTPRQINILKALGAPIPIYAHISMILDANKKKLSKRNNALDISFLKKEGYLPEAVLNYLLRLGWSYGNKEIFHIHEMKSLFTLKNIVKSASLFDKNKMLWINSHYIKNTDIKIVEQHLKYFFNKQKINIKKGPSIKKIIKFFSHRFKNLKDMCKSLLFLYQKLDFSSIKYSKIYLNKNSLLILKNIKIMFKKNKLLTVDHVFPILKKVSFFLNLELEKVLACIRFVLTGRTFSPSISEVIFLIGKKNFLKKINNAERYILNSNNKETK